jgi:import inner membrane translocase subunit TIM16
MSNATSGSRTDQMTRTHRMTLDEAHLILNVKRGEVMEKVMQVCTHFTFNVHASALLTHA